MKKYILPLLAAYGLFMGIRTVFLTNKTPPVAQPFAEPAKAPYAEFVAGSGIIEASSENIAIAASVGGVVKSVAVKPGDVVEQGAVLFVIDDRAQLANVAVKEAAVAVSKAKLQDARDLLSLWKGVGDPRAVSAEDMTKRKNTTAIASEELVLAERELDVSKTDLERLYVRAPIAGQVLQVKVRAGEYASASASSQPLMVLGRTGTLNVRVDTDENDSWRIRPGARGMASLRGNSSITTKLEFVRFEPYVVPKRSLTGESQERVDTRVLQIIFSYNPKDFPAFVGQQVDVFIDADPSPVSSGYAGEAEVSATGATGAS